MATIVINLNHFVFVIYKCTTRQLGLMFLNHEAHEIFLLLTRHEPIPGVNLRWPILPIWDFPVSPARKVLLMETFIDKACLVKMAGYWPCSFLHFFYLNFILVLKKTQETWPISSYSVS